MQSNITLKHIKLSAGKAIIGMLCLVQGFSAFSQCIAPVSPTICAGQIQQLTANTGGQTFTQSTVVNMPAGQPTTTSGNFGPYPSTIVVSGLPTSGYGVATITFNGISHTWTSDLDIVLVSPSGQPVILLSDASGSNDMINANIVFKDGAAVFPNVNPIPSGTYAPINVGAADTWPAPGPGGVTQATPTLSTYTGNFNGTWSLYGLDQFAGDFGKINSWSITFTPLPAATVSWTGAAGTIFTDAAATVPYVTGSNSSVVFVKPTVTTTYTATISSGPCAGVNTNTVNVNPLPVVTVSPSSACGPVVLTASGANTYAWSPALGLSGTTGATVTANPAATTTYTVTGTTTATGCVNTATALVNSAPTASVLSSPVAFNFQLNEGFDAAPAGWLVQNNSNPIGTTSWFLSTNAVFPAFDGAPTAAAGANFNSGAGTSNISTWLFAPVINIKNGDVFSFWTRAATGGGVFPDRLEARLSTNGASTNVGATDATVGDFTTVLQSVNPTLTTTGYPEVWTKYTVIISGITGTVSGRIAFRYFVTNGGPLGANSNFIGLDRVQYGTPPSAICVNTVSNLAVNVTGGVGPYTVVYNDGTNNITYNNYTSGSTINVTPSVTTTYTLVSVTGANGCVGTGNSGSATISITPPATITGQPTDKSACIGGNTSFTVTPNTTNATSYQWQVNTVPSPGVPAYTTITNGGVYSGATTNVLTITGATAAMNGYTYRAIVTGFCGGNVTSAAATLTVNAPAAITAQPVATFAGCVTNSQTLTVGATGNQLVYQWQISTDGGTTFTNLANNATYGGVTTNTVTISNIAATMLNNQYRVLVSSGGCTPLPSLASVLNTINPAPTVTISSAPGSAVAPGAPVTLTAAVSTVTSPVSYQWFLNNVAIPGATSATYVAGADGIGFYTVKVTGANACTTTVSTPLNITLTAAASNTLFIYPSPNSGIFQVRYYNAVATPTSPAFTFLNVFDSKGTRVFFQKNSISGPYSQMNVDLGSHGKGVYRVELTDDKGDRIKTGSVIVF
jgi:subtilisin-like proprotein convertase family protein